MQSPTSEVSKTAKSKSVKATTEQGLTEKPAEKVEDQAQTNANIYAREDSLEDITMGLNTNLIVIYSSRN